MAEVGFWSRCSCCGPVRLLSEVVLLCVVQEKKSSAESQAMFNGLLAEASVEAKALLQVEAPLAAGVFLFFGWGGSPAMVGTRATRSRASKLWPVVRTLGMAPLVVPATRSDQCRHG
jgi:hypothetical protein